MHSSMNFFHNTPGSLYSLFLKSLRHEKLFSPLHPASFLRQNNGRWVFVFFRYQPAQEAAEQHLCLRERVHRYIKLSV